VRACEQGVEGRPRQLCCVRDRRGELGRRIVVRSEDAGRLFGKRAQLGERIAEEFPWMQAFRILARLRVAEDAIDEAIRPLDALEPPPVFRREPDREDQLRRNRSSRWLC